MFRKTVNLRERRFSLRLVAPEQRACFPEGGRGVQAKFL